VALSIITILGCQAINCCASIFFSAAGAITRTFSFHEGWQTFALRLKPRSSRCPDTIAPPPPLAERGHSSFKRDRHRHQPRCWLFPTGVVSGGLHDSPILLGSRLLLRMSPARENPFRVALRDSPLHGPGIGGPEIARRAADATEICVCFKKGILRCPGLGKSCRRMVSTSPKSIRSR